MKHCPFCAEEIQDAAIVCKHCGRDLPGQATEVSPARPKKTSKAPLAVLVGLGLAAGTCGLFIWGNSAYSVDVERARAVIEDLERTGIITERSCNPNRATIGAAAWRGLQSAQLRENLLNSLARLCIEAGTGPEMRLYDTSGALVANFDGSGIR